MPRPPSLCHCALCPITAHAVAAASAVAAPTVAAPLHYLCSPPPLYMPSLCLPLPAHAVPVVRRRLAPSPLYMSSLRLPLPAQAVSVVRRRLAPVRPLLTQQSLRPSLLLCGCTGHRACTHCAPVAVPTPVLHPSLSNFSESITVCSLRVGKVGC